MAEVRFTVVVPAYNAARTIERAVDSVMAQTEAATEIIVVDDGSSDGTAAIVAKYPAPVSCLRQSNRGAAAARNAGIQAAACDWVALLDADDYWEPQKLACHKRLYDELPELVVTCSRYYEQLPGNQERYEVSPSIGRAPLYDQVWQPRGWDLFDAACCIWTGTVVAPRGALLKHPFQSGLEPAEDRDVWRRLLQEGPLWFQSEPLATAVLESNSLSRTNINRDCGNMLRVVESAAGEFGSAGARPRRARTYRRWAAEHLGTGDGAAALRPAWKRLSLQPWSAEAWWIALKSTSLAGWNRPHAPAGSS